MIPLSAILSAKNVLFSFTLPLQPLRGHFLKEAFLEAQSQRQCPPQYSPNILSTLLALEYWDA